MGIIEKEVLQRSRRRRRLRRRLALGQYYVDGCACCDELGGIFSDSDQIYHCDHAQPPPPTRSVKTIGLSCKCLSLLSAAAVESQ